jgi:hypothetical protein
VTATGSACCSSSGDIESFERIRRSNLVGMGVLPLTFKDGQDRKLLGLDGSEIIDPRGIAGGITPGMDVAATINRAGGRAEPIARRCRIDSLDEIDYFRPGGIHALRPAPAARASPPRAAKQVPAVTAYAGERVLTTGEERGPRDVRRRVNLDGVGCAGRDRRREPGAAARRLLPLA